MRAGSRNGSADSPGWIIHSHRWRPGDIGSETIGRAGSPTKWGWGALASGRSTVASTTSQRCTNVEPPKGIPRRERTALRPPSHATRNRAESFSAGPPPSGRIHALTPVAD